MISLLKKINSHFQIKARLQLFIKSIFTTVFFLNKPNWWSSYIIQSLNENTAQVSDDHNYFYSTLNPLLLWRAQTLFTKEPETIKWLKTMKPTDILFDVGANVGMYSIYAGVRGVRVYSFEPEASNSYILNKNIARNKLSEKVTAFSFALADEEAVNVLKLTSFVPGSAHNTFGDNEAFNQTDWQAVFHQGCFCTTLDNMVYKYHLPVPNFLKIDVDGIEAKIIKGAQKLLADDKLKSILIELNEDMEEDRWIKAMLEKNGFKVAATSKGDFALKNKMVLRDYIFVRG